jgi:hypothetical protein
LPVTGAGEARAVDQDGDESALFEIANDNELQ